MCADHCSQLTVGNAASDPFQRLPHPVPTLLLQYLDSRSRKRLAHALPTNEAFRPVLRVYIPPDAARRDPLIQQLTTASFNSETRMSRFSILDRRLRSELETVVDQAEDIEITRLSDRWPRRRAIDATTWPLLQSFHHLVRLKIERQFGDCDEIDLALLSRCLPQLQKLSIRECLFIENKLQGLADLHTLKLIDTNINTFAVTEGSPKLSSVCIWFNKSPRSCSRVSLDLGDLVAPLRVLKACGGWGGDGSAKFRRHAATLEKLHLVDGDMRSYDIASRLLSRGRFPVLRSLNLGHAKLIDLQPLTRLVSLEELTLKMHQDATTCAPLQQLHRLRKLSITRGWLRDIIGKLPKLQQLDIRDRRFSREPQHARAVLDTPQDASVHSDLRELSLEGKIEVVVHDTLLAYLDRVEQVKIHSFCDAMQMIPVIQRLPRLKRIFIEPRHRGEDCELARDTPLASVRCLQEVSVPQWMAPSVPAWLANATQLRKLHLAQGTTSIVHCPPNVSHLYAFPSRDSEIVHKICARKLLFLRVVSIPDEADCLVLRRERRADGALPLLQCILHPVADCLSVSSSTTERHGFC